VIYISRSPGPKTVTLFQLPKLVVILVVSLITFEILTHKARK